jgi:type IV pilus assembly protein PilC
MSSYAYVAVDPQGDETRGTLQVADQNEAVRRIKEMGLFPTKVLQERRQQASRARRAPPSKASWLNLSLPLGGTGVKTAALTVFTRQLATLIEAGMPLLRSLRTLQEQTECHPLRAILGVLADDVEGGNSFTEAVAAHPRVFNKLYVNMVKAGEIGGALDVTLCRLADFMEKAQRIRSRIKAAMFYPCAVLLVALAIVGVLMAYVVPRFKTVFDSLLNGTPLPTFTQYVLNLSLAVQHHTLTLALAAGTALALLAAALRTEAGHWAFDLFKLRMPILGTVFRKAAIARFARTLGTLVSSGVPILQALTIVRETAANRVVGKVISEVHDHVKQGDPIAPTLKTSSVFPAMVAGMVDVGEQTGALPEMLLKIAERYDEEVDNAATAMTSLLEPIMIVFLALVVGSIVIAMFMPIITIITTGIPTTNGGKPED